MRKKIVGICPLCTGLLLTEYVENDHATVPFPICESCGYQEVAIEVSDRINEIDVSRYLKLKKKE